MYYIYNTLLLLVLPFFILIYLPFFLAKKKHRINFSKRLKKNPLKGSLPKHEGPKVWVHAVSVGEVLSSIPFVKGVKEALPEAVLCFSTITVTGFAVAEEKIMPLVDHLFYLPFDLPWLTGSIAKELSPQVLAIMETELWPNLIWSVKREGGNVVIVNGRISDSSLPLYRSVRFFFRSLLGCIDLFLMQSKRDMERIISLGAPSERVEVMKNLKYDAPPTRNEELAELVNSIRGLAEKRMVIIGASTHEGEEELLLRSLSPLKERVFPVIAPRHPERCKGVEELAGTLNWSSVKRSVIGEKVFAEKNADMILLDTLGELNSLFGMADLVVMGGSFVDVGGHNVFEVAAHKKPIIIGRYYSNFKDIVELLKEEDAIRIARDRRELEESVEEFVKDGSLRSEMGKRAYEVVSRYRGVGEDVARKILSLTSRGRR